LLNPNIKMKFQEAIAYQKAEIMEMIQRIDLFKSYKSLFQTLWYSYMPCFIVKKHSSVGDDVSLLRYCEWKGVPVACSTVFTTFPTDQGLCCSFNMKAAEEIFIESKFQDIIKATQNFDKNDSYLSVPFSAAYIPSKRPQIGVNKGLMLLIDIHSHWLYPGSFDGDFHTFTAIIQSNGSFPLVSQDGLAIRPGHNNIITLTSTKINADDNIKSIHEEDRNCLFPEENSDLMVHKKYSYANCKFDCAFNYSKREIDSKKCQPWFFPMSNDSSIKMCDPWTSNKFFLLMKEKVPDSLCLHCLPDCSSTLYEAKVIAVPFKRCDRSNLGVSRFCQMITEQPMEENLLSQMLNEFTNVNFDGYNGNNRVPPYLEEIHTSFRRHGYNIFKKSPLVYNAFEKDIAMVEIIFQKSTLIEIESQVRMTWIDYFSAVGGLLGLVLGMGFFSLFELIWLCLRITSKKLNTTKWIT